MTIPDLREAARQLAAELSIPPQSGGVWTWVEEGRDEILVEVRPDARVTVPPSFRGYRVRVEQRLNPTVRGVHNDF
jgi:hypothetical protein